MPWWGAVLIALTATAVGFAFDAGSGNKELSAVFAVCYVAGCLLAVLAVRQAGLFTAVIQPPIVLFVTVPGSYFLFHGGQINGLKDLAINCGYPLIERFPLMFFTSAAILLIGLVRWYHGMSAQRAVPAATKEPPQAVTALMSTVTTKLTGLVTGRRAAAAGDDAAAAATARPRKRAAAARADRGAGNGTARRTTTRSRGSSRADATARTADGSRRPRRRPTAETADQPPAGTRSRRSTKAAPPRSRPSRAADTEYIEPVAERPRRRRPVNPDEAPAPPRRRPRGEAPRERNRDRSQPPRSRRVSPRDPRRQPPVERPGFDPMEPRAPRPRRAGRFEDWEPREPHTRAGARGSTHHPVSRVRYRGSEDGAERAEYRNRPSRARRAHDWEADSWEYDI